MEYSCNNKTNDFYEESFLENQILNDSDKKNSNNLSKNNSNCILLCSELKERIENRINIIESNNLFYYYENNL